MVNYRKISTHILAPFLVICLFQIAASSQVQYSGWVASFNTFKLSQKWSVHLDVQGRSTDEFQKIQTVLIRPGLNYHVNKQLSLTAGYAFISNQRSVSGVSDMLPEHRIWQQAIYAHKWSTVSITHRFRFEERFISKAKISANELEADGYDNAFRFRYFVRTITPLTKQSNFTKGAFFALQNEVFLNTGNKSAVNGNSFDQNRLFLALGYRLLSKIDLEAGYLNQYVRTRTSFTNNHIAQLAIYKRL